jgi:NAD(P)H-dependent FMN reductase
MTTLLLISGSQRRQSWNARLLDHLAFSLQWQCAVDMLEPCSIGLPLFDQDLETDAAVLATLTALHQRFSKCSGIIVACPEYNGQATPLLKNTVDWVSRLAHIDDRFGNPFLDKPVLLCSASTGWSGGAMVMGPSISIARADDQWTASGFQFDDAKDSQIEAAVSALLQWAGQSRQVSEPESLTV